MSVFNEVIALLIKADAGGAVRPLKDLEGQAARTATAWDRAGKKIGVSGAALKAGLGGLVGIATLEQAARGILAAADRYAAAAKSANDLAAATGASVEEISRMQAALVDAGVSAEASAKLITNFATAAGTKKGADTLRALNVELVRGQSGAVDYAATMTQAVDAIGQMGDAAQRNTALVALFRRQGAQAFQDLLNSGKTFAEAQREIARNRIFTEQDAINAAKYDDAVDAVNASLEGLTNTIGRGVVPAVATATGGLAQLMELLDGADPTALAAGFNPLVGALSLLDRVTGGATERTAAYRQSIEDAKSAQQQLTELIASGVTSGQAFADAVGAAGDELAEQAANARLAGQALDVYRASTDQAYESTLKLLGLDRSERSAQRAAEGAADSAADAKANLDQALATANAAKTVVEKIAGIQGRARRRREEEGIVEGSVDVSAIEGIQGRRAQTRTRVLEAAGYITPAEQRQIREATRQYEEALDDISDAWIRLGEARVKHKEALGLTLTEAEKLDEIRRALREGLQVPGLSADAKKDIRADLRVVEEQIKRLGGVPVVIDGVRFAPGTSEKAVEQLTRDIAAAMKVDPGGAGAALKGQLDAMTIGGPVDLKATLGLDDASVAATQKALANVGIDPKTGKPYTAKTIATLDKARAQAELDALTKDRTMTVTVDMVPGTSGFGGNSPLAPFVGPRSVPGGRGNRIDFGTGGAAVVNFSPQVTVNNPVAERASDSIAMSLRTAKYLVGAR